jgi:UDP-N-acetylglucosamine 2-epimerase (non-hydrolysing)
LSAILAANPDVRLTIPVHPNPNASGPIRARFTGHARVSLTPPLGYREFVAAMRRAVLILTDSGGVQEEAPALGRPVLVLREKTERPEAIAAGVAALVGTTATGISSAAQHLLDDPEAYGRMASGGSPYGDGRASARIVSALAAGLSGQNARLAGEAAVPWRCGPWPPPPTTVAEDREPQGDRRAA